MATYWKVGTLDDELAYYVWADNAAHAKRKVENYYDLALPPQRTVVKQTDAGSIPEGDDVIDEPELEREARTDGEEG